MNKIEFVQTFNDYLYSLQVLLKNEGLDAKSLISYELQFQKEQLEFHNRLTDLADYDISSLENLGQHLAETLEKTKEIEHSFRSLLQKNSSSFQPTMIKKLRSIADLFRSGEDRKGYDEFKTSIPDGEGSIAGDVFGALWKVKKQPDIWDVGRRSFYNEVPDCRSTPLQKALAIEIAMVKVIYKALEQGNQDQAYAEFRELPYRLKQRIYILLAPNSEVEIGRKHFFNPDFQKETKIACLKAFEKQLEETYPNVGELEFLSLLQQDFRETLQGKNEVENDSLLQGERSRAREMRLVETLRFTQQAVFKTLLGLRKKIQEQELQLERGQKDLELLKHKAIEIQFSAEVREGILRAEFERQMTQLKQENARLKKDLEMKNDHDFVQLSKPTHEEIFADYVTQHCPNYKAEEVKQFIEEGKQLVEKIQNGQAAFIPISERKNAVVPLVWYMLYYSVCKNQGFGQGTIVFRDPGHAIVKFFLACGQPAVYPRLSSHFKGRLLPTFFEGNEQTTTYGIDIVQNYKSGLPANKQTINFCPIETKDGLDWSFLKPEDWGLGDWYQLLGHTWDYFATCPAHFIGDPNGPGYRKEHLPHEMKEIFLGVYSQATGNKQVPEGVKKFGIAGIKAILESMTKDESIDGEIKQEITQLLSDLRHKYDYLNTRNGNEAILGNSFIEGEFPEPNIYQSITELDLLILKAKDAQIRIKNAVHNRELLVALGSLKGRQELWTKKEGQVEEIALGFQVDRDTPNSALKKDDIFAQVNKDLQRWGNVKFLIDGCEFKNPETLYAYLHAVEPFSAVQKSEGKDRMVLSFMAMLQQGARADLFLQLQTWFEQPLNGIRIKQYSPKPNEIVCEIIVNTGKTPMIEMKQLFQLFASDEENRLFFRKEPYALIEGSIKIDFLKNQTSIGSTIREVYP